MFVSGVCDAMKLPAADLLSRLEAEPSVHVEVLEELLDRLEHLECRIEATAMSNQPNIGAFNTLRVYVNKILENQRLLPDRPTGIPDNQSTTETNITPTLTAGLSSENLQTISFRTQARMKTIDLLFSTHQKSAERTPVERHVLFTNDIANISLEKIERVGQSIRKARPNNPALATAAAPQAQGTTEALENTSGRAQEPTDRRPTTNTNCRSTVDEEDDKEEVPLEPTRHTNQRHTTSRSNHPTSHTYLYYASAADIVAPLVHIV